MTYIIAEMSGNHNGDRKLALKLIEAAAKCGCDAIKFQLYKPEDMHDPENNHIYEKYRVPTYWLQDFYILAHMLNIELFASVFAPWAVQELRRYGVRTFKIASPESTRLPDYRPIIEEIRKDPEAEIIFSTGMADYEDVISWEEWSDSVLYCKAGYPAVLTEEDLRFIKHNGLGFSDHTVGIVSTLAAIGAGANVIEKHFKITENCIDAAFSLNPDEMRTLCDLS